MSVHWDTIKLRDELVSSNGGTRPTVTFLDNLFSAVEKGIEFGGRIQTRLSRPEVNFKTTENVPTGASFSAFPPALTQNMTPILIIGAIVVLGFMFARR